MKESLLHHIFYQKKLGFKFSTTKGETIEILDFGQFNEDAGPDFLNVKISFDNKIWFGPLEFHIRSSDWYRHNHQSDDRYKNVIAHFVYEHDQEVRSGDYLLPTVELKEQIDKKDFQKFKDFISPTSTIGCTNLINHVDRNTIDLQVEIAVNQRLKRKANECSILIDRYGLEKAFYIQVAGQLGSNVNRASFQKLVEQIDFKWISKLNYNSQKVEALLFGIAGLIPENSENSYVLYLKNEFDYIKNLLDLDNTFSKLEWKYSTMRPSNFPDIRIAQLAGLMVNIRHNSISDILMADYQMFLKVFDVNLHPFWKEHYRLGNKTKPKKSTLSRGAIDLLIINAINPISYFIGTRTSNSIYKEQVLNRLKLIGPENNKIVRQWNRLSIWPDNALDSQALIETKNEFCNEKKCLFCAIGKSILNK